MKDYSMDIMMSPKERQENVNKIYKSCLRSMDGLYRFEVKVILDKINIDLDRTTLVLNPKKEEDGQ